MFLTNTIVKKFPRHLITLVVVSGSVLLNISTVRASQEFERDGQAVEQISSDSLNHQAMGNKVSATRLEVLPATLNLIKQHEGFRSYAYIDTSGLPVIGYGQTRINGQTVTMGQYITQAQADAELEKEVYRIQRLVLERVKVDLNPNQLGALTSLVYNAGTRVITQSTLIRKLNAGDYIGAAKEFPRWNKANLGGRLVALPGLTKRRLEEQKLFLSQSF